jgi:hypothetical protein
MAHGMSFCRRNISKPALDQFVAIHRLFDSVVELQSMLKLQADTVIRQWCERFRNDACRRR